jgi:hypothetical protein
MTDPYRSVVDALSRAGWKVRDRGVEHALSVSDLFPAAVRERYPNIPPSVTEFLGRLDECMNGDATAWFLTAADYAGTSDSEWAWNAWEQLEVEGCEENGDDEGAAKVREFWNAYLPVFLDVGGDYAHFAVRVTEPPVVKRSWWLPGGGAQSEPRMGAVVYGAEVDITGVFEVAPSFPEFLNYLAAAVRDPNGKGPLSGLI